MTDVSDADSLQQASSAADADLTNQVAAHGKRGAVTACPLKCSVKIILRQGNVACPGLPLTVYAQGTPAGGTYSWTPKDQAELEISSDDTQSKVIFRKLPEPNSGGIPSETVKLTVCYTHSGCQAKESVDVKVHGVRFQVTNLTDKDIKMTNLTVTREPLMQAGSERVTIGEQYRGVQPLIKADPKISIHVDSSCTRPTECAGNYQAGFIQDVTSGYESIKYRSRPQSEWLRKPTRDTLNQRQAQEGEGELAEFPFMYGPVPFQRNDQTVDPEFEDSPRLGATSDASDPNFDTTIDQMDIRKSFTTWLVAQNIAWSKDRNLTESLIFLKHFSWSIEYSVHRSKVGAYLPSSSIPHLDPVSDGMGGVAPSFSENIANDHPNSWTSEVPRSHVHKRRH